MIVVSHKSTENRVMENLDQEGTLTDIAALATALQSAEISESFMSAAAWESIFQDAVHESDPIMAEAKIRKAEAAIFERINDYSSCPGSLEEQALLDALGTIKVLRSVRRIGK